MAHRPKPPVPRPRRRPPPLFIGAWIRRLGLKQVDVARGAGIGESYMSSIVSGNKYPGPAVLAAIASVMGVPEHVLRQPPPDEAAIRAIGDLDPAIISRLQPKHPN